MASLDKVIEEVDEEEDDDVDGEQEDKKKPEDLKGRSQKEINDSAYRVTVDQLLENIEKLKANIDDIIKS